MMKYKFFCAILTFSLLATFSCKKTETVANVETDSQIIILKNGSEYKGRLVSIDEDRVIFVTGDQTLDVGINEVNKINFSQKRLYENVTNVSQINDVDIAKAFQTANRYKARGDSKYVTVLNKRVYELEQSGGVCTTTKAVKILNKQGLSVSTQVVNYLKKSGNAKLIYALTIAPNGEVSHIDESAVNDEPVNNKFPLYDNEHRIKFGHKNVETGSLLIWQARVDFTYDNEIKPFNVLCTLADDEPILNYQLEINHDKNIRLTYQKYDGCLPKLKVAIKNGATKFSLSAENIAAVEIDEDDTPSNSILLPQVFVSTNATYAEISDKFTQTYFENVPTEIWQFADKIVSGIASTDKNALADAIYYHINRNIDLVSLPLSVTSFVPSEVSRLVSSSVLNVLDKSYLFTLATRHLGLDSRLIFYTTTDKTFFGDIDCITNFNQLICKIAAPDGEKYYSFVNKNYSAGVIPYNADGAFCLDVSTQSDLSHLPNVEPSKNVTKRTVEAKLESDGSLTFKQTTVATGDAMAGWRDLRYLSKELQDRFVGKRALNYGKDVSVVSYKFVSDFSDFSEPPVFEECYKINNFAYHSGDNILIKMASLGLNYNASTVSKPSRVFAYDLAGISRLECDCHLTLPVGYKISFAPEKSECIFNGGQATFGYDIGDGELNLTFNQTFNDRYISSQNYPDFKYFVEKRAEFFGEWIVLTKY